MFIVLNKGTGKLCAQLFAYIFLFFTLFSTVNAGSMQTKNYLRLEQSKLSETYDFKISSIGALAFIGNKQGHIDLSYLESDFDKNEWTVDIGGGYVFNGDMSLFLGLGISLGYDQSNEDFISAYYPEVGLVVDVSESFGITVSAKRFYNRFDENEDIIMMGLVFRE